MAKYRTQRSSLANCSQRSRQMLNLRKTAATAVSCHATVSPPDAAQQHQHRLPGYRHFGLGGRPYRRAAPPSGRGAIGKTPDPVVSPYRR